MIWQANNPVTTASITYSAHRTKTKFKIQKTRNIQDKQIQPKVQIWIRADTKEITHQDDLCICTWVSVLIIYISASRQGRNIVMYHHYSRHRNINPCKSINIAYIAKTYLSKKTKFIYFLYNFIFISPGQQQLG